MTYDSKIYIIVFQVRDMKKFNYESIFILAHGDPTKMLHYFKESSVGINFIVNPKALVDAFWVTDRQKAEYLGICALRSYSDYQTKGEVDLSLDLVPNWVSLDIIKQNPLIQLTETKIRLLKEKI